MNEGQSTHRAGHAARTGAIGTLVGGIAFFDALFVGLPIAVLSAWVGPLIAFSGAALAVTFVSVACCSWVNRQWDSWFSGNGRRIEEKLKKLRSSRLMRRPLGWIEHGSDGRYALAAALINPVIAVGLARFVG